MFLLFMKDKVHSCVMNPAAHRRFFPSPAMKMTTRRQFLQSAAPLILPAAVLGRAGAVSPNGKIRLACIGVGGQGSVVTLNII